MSIMKKEIVLTAFDLVSPIGVGTEEFWESLTAGKSGVGYSTLVAEGSPNRPLTAETPDFRPKDYVKPKKNIKVMSRDMLSLFRCRPTTQRGQSAARTGSPIR